ncbi:APC family permease [Caldanaerobacter subterraneus]|uniref:APC family permease n=1 Tax=Caldanaerobacter subterraneus TaxID=911092 RepID=UPI00031CDC91
MFWPSAATGTLKNVIAVSLIIILSFINYFGIRIVEYINNIVTISKILPLIVFIVLGLFFVNSENFNISAYSTHSGLWAAIVLVFYAFAGFESLVIVAGDIENPKRNLPIALLISMGIVSLIYILTQVVAIGTLGEALKGSPTPVADAAKSFLGEFGLLLVTIGSLISIGGVNLAYSFNTPRVGVALAEEGILPKMIAKKSKYDTPYIAIIITALLAIPLVLTGTFVKLAMISVVSRFAQYIPTSLAIIVLRKREVKTNFKLPFGIAIPTIATILSIYFLSKASIEQLVWGLGGLILAMPLYFLFKYTS